MTRIAWFAAPLLVLAACGDDGLDTPLLGTWQVATHTRNDMGCTGEGAAETDPPFLRFIATDIFGTEVAELVDCTSATMCEESASLFGKLYSESISGGLRFQTYFAAGDDTQCTLGGLRSDATVDASGRLRIEERSYSSAPMAVTCDTDTAEAMFATLPCGALEIYTATRAP